MYGYASFFLKKKKKKLNNCRPFAFLPVAAKKKDVQICLKRSPDGTA